MGLKEIKLLVEESRNFSKLLRKTNRAGLQKKPISIPSLKKRPLLDTFEHAKISLQENKGVYTIIDNATNTEVASAYTFMDGNSVSLFQISSKVKNQGYGKKLINQIKKDYIETGKADSIKLNASWEDYPTGFPPHKFYIKNGFVPDNKEQATLLQDWINKGGKVEDFPIFCFDCNMTYKS